MIYAIVALWVLSGWVGFALFLCSTIIVGISAADIMFSVLFGVVAGPLFFFIWGLFELFHWLDGITIIRRRP